MIFSCKQCKNYGYKFHYVKTDFISYGLRNEVCKLDNRLATGICNKFEPKEKIRFKIKIK